MTDFTLIWKTDTGANGGTLKLVLLAIGYCARIDGVCYARRAKLSALTGLHQKTVDRACRELADKGFISMRERRSAEGRQLTSLIVLTLSGHVRTDDSSDDLEPHELLEFGEDGRPIQVFADRGTQIPDDGQSAGRLSGQSAGRQGAERGTLKGLSKDQKDTEEGAGAQDSDFLKSVMSRWNNLAEIYGFPISKLLDSRKASIRARTREYGRDAWPKVFEIIEGSAFLRGQTSHGYKLTIDKLTTSRIFSRTVEGNYTGGATPKRAGAESNALAAFRADPAAQRAWAQRWKQDRGDWPADYGPAPDQPGCILADSVLYGIGLAPGGLPLSHEPPAGDEEAFLDD